MTADVELLPLPPPPCRGKGWEPQYREADMRVYARANVAHATAAKDAEIEALQGAYLAQLAERANEIRLREKAEVRAEALRAKARYALDNAARSLTAARAARDAAEVRAERLAEAGRRVTAAFRALGEATAWTRAAEQARHECEAAMLALDAALEQENDDA